jgi:WD40 repeat protein
LPGTTLRMPLNSPGLLFTRDGGSLFVLDLEFMVRQWDLRTGREVRSWHAPSGPMTLALSPDEARCLVLGRAGSRCTASLYNLTTGQEQTRELLMANVEDVTFSPDGTVFAAASSFGGAKIWSAATLEEIAALPAYQDATFSAGFSPDGKRLVIGGSSTLKLWDVDSRQEVLTLPAEGGMFWPVAFSADGNLLGVTNYKGELQVWQAPPFPPASNQGKSESALAANKGQPVTF